MGKKKTEFKVGETFQFGLDILKCVSSTGTQGCDDCFLGPYNTCRHCGDCDRSERSDNQDVIFIKIGELEE